MTLILTNVIQAMILNNIQEILAVSRTACIMLMLAVLLLSSLITCKVLNENKLNYNVLESSRGKLQEYVMKNKGFYLKNSK